MSDRLGKYFDNIRNLDDEDDANDFAMAVMSMVVGALTLSRVMKDEEVSDKLLLAARKAILEYDELRKKT